MNATFKFCARLFIAVTIGIPNAFAIEEEATTKDEPTLNAKIGYDRSKGKYGQSQYSVVSITSTTVTYDVDDYSFDVVVPYVHQQGPGRLISIPGRRPTVIVGPDQKASGLGDVTAGVTRYLLTEEDNGVDLDFGGIAKFSTASSAKGLGSGKDDLSFQSVLSHALGSFNGALTVGYTFVGKPDGQRFKNAFYGSFDGSYRISKTTSVGVTFSEGGSIADGLPRSRDVTYYINFKPFKGVKVDIYAISGRSAQSPDNGFGMTISSDF